ncbi:MAG: hypothetical protein ACSHX9_01720 [Luteolibacter sp.]
MKTTFQSKMTATAIAAMVGTLALTTSYAEEAPVKPAVEEEAEPKFPDWIQKEIDKISAAVPGLTGEQKTQIADAFKTRTEAIAKANEEDADADAIKEIWSVYVRKVNTIMTPEQFVKFQELMKPKAKPAPAE